MIVVIMGVSGAGKTTIGEVLAERLGWPFYDADDFHTPANKQKMNAGIPLNDDDRKDWLLALQALIHANDRAGQSILLACSALKERYRQILCEGSPHVRFVHLNGSRELIADRLAERKDHYMNPALLDSQFEALEVPEDAVIVDISGEPEAVAEAALKALGLT